MTAHVERLTSGHIVKYPTPNPYLPSEEESHRANMRIEVEVYRRVGDCPFIPKLIDWDPETCCLTIEHLERRDLRMYMRGYDEVAPDLVGVTVIPLQVRKRWTLQAASGLAALYAVEVIHCDVTPRKFLLSGDLDFYVADFAGSFIDGSAATVAPSPRYLPPGWSWAARWKRPMTSSPLDLSSTSWRAPSRMLIWKKTRWRSCSRTQSFHASTI